MKQIETLTTPFLGLDEEMLAPEKRVVVLPCPIEATTSWQKGTAQGPQALLEASSHMEIYDEELNQEIWRCGIITDKAIGQGCTVDSLPSVLNDISQRVRQYQNDKLFPVGIGGEHSISTGLVRPWAEQGPLSVLQLDAHADLRDEYDGTPYSHAAVMSRLLEMDCQLTQVGIRSLTQKERSKIEADDRITTFFDFDTELADPKLQSEIVASLGPRVYVTVDLDGFNPAIMPATGTPEPGGLEWKPVLSLLKKVFLEKEVVACDVNELMPREQERSSDFLAARLVHKMIGYQALSQGWLS